MTQEAFMILDGDILNSKEIILSAIAKQTATIYAVGALLIIIGIAILCNQIRIRKQLRRIQEQLDAVSERNNAGGDNQGE